MAQLDALVSFSPLPANLQRCVLGLTDRNARIHTRWVQKQEQKHRAARQSTGSSIRVHTRTNNEHQNTELHFTRMAIAPNVDGDRTIALVTSVMSNAHDNTADDHTRLPTTRPQVLQVAKCTIMAVSQPEQLRIERFELCWLPCGV